MLHFVTFLIIITFESDVKSNNSGKRCGMRPTIPKIIITRIVSAKKKNVMITSLSGKESDFFMKVKIRRAFSCIQEENGPRFQEEMNKILGEHLNVKITYPPAPPFTAYLEYQIEEHVPETIAEEYEVAGAMHRCKECPHLERTSDARRKRFPCQYATYGISSIDMPCCDRFYEELESGVIKL